MYYPILNKAIETVDELDVISDVIPVDESDE